MAKRFIDTDMWNKNWFRKLPVKIKLVWIYLMTRCNHAGLYDIDIELMGFLIGQKITVEEIKEHLGERVFLINDNKWFIDGFIEFQYKSLNENVKAHYSVIEQLKKYNIEIGKSMVTLSKGLGNPLEGVKDKDKVKDKNKDKDKKNVIPPKTEWVRGYMQSLNIPDFINESEKFFHFYESKGWFIGKNKMINWQSAVVNWGKGIKNKPDKNKHVPTMDDYKEIPVIDKTKLESDIERLKDNILKITKDQKDGHGSKPLERRLKELKSSLDFKQKELEDL